MATREPRTRKEKAVWEACDILVANSQTPTYLAIGEQLVKLGYKRGSNSDIRRYLTSWKDGNPAAKPSSPKVTDSRPLPLLASKQSPIDIQKLLELYEHHATQIDRLLKVIENQRLQNQRLKEKLAKIKPRVRVNAS